MKALVSGAFVAGLWTRQISTTPNSAKISPNFLCFSPFHWAAEQWVGFGGLKDQWVAAGPFNEFYRDRCRAGFQLGTAGRRPKEGRRSDRIIDDLVSRAVCREMANAVAD